MISTKNPFSGMNPWLQQSWRDVHTRLISYISDALSPELPPDLASRTERRVALMDEGRPPVTYITDVAVTESWRHGLPPVWTPDDDAAIDVAEPLLLDAEPLTERWVEILDLDGRVITVIEVLSPSNKQGDDRPAFRAKTRGYLEAGVNLVEIDLIRGGQHNLRVAESELPRSNGTTHYICVCRAILKHRREVYPCPLRERLPAIRIPLRPTDPDIPLDLQPLIDRCYELGRYWQTNWSEPLNPPLPDDDALWAQEQLKAAGLIP